MKKLLLFVAVATLSFTAAQSQNVRFGAKAGVNFSSLNGSDIDNVDMLTGLHVGAVARIGISELFAIQPEIVYSLQGYSLDDDLKVNLNYINLPIMVDFTLAEGFSLQAGPQVGFNLSSKVDFDGEKEDAEGVQTVDIGAGLGAQYILPMNLFFQARYVTGLTSVFEDFDGESFDAKNSVISLSVGYFFN
ncbi:porin family protein [Aequorivita sp. CIP111184]|uniref:porin family protein n=1 Tax=Aequorivita sp. CIP111184 TaxID=2211356 RepID=UPI000DBC2E3A|nr:porin family protein [Aequorivita sp. CIP111184]SRX55811.1 hypothetical protein AEQU1_02836 [Aequorivita sp. CIP111184]